MSISLTVIDIILVSLALQGLILSVMLFYSSKKIRSNKWLAAFIFVLSYSIFGMEVLMSSIPAKFPLIYAFIPQLRMALGPLLFFYTRSLLYGNEKLKRRDYLHFSALLLETGPQIAFIFHFSGLLLIPGIKTWYLPFEKQIISFESGNLASLPFFFSFVIYSVVCFKMVRRNQIAGEASPYKFKDVKWLKTLLQVVFYIVAIWFSALIASYLPLPHLVDVIRYLMPLLAVIFAYWLGMSAYFRQSKMSDHDVIEYNKPPVKAYFPDDEADNYERQLIMLMEIDKIYLNPALKLDFLAVKLGVSEKLLSSLLNQHVGKNFNDFINEYRVQEVQRKLNDPAFRQFTIAAIAFDCGFNSLATFQRCFKQYTGITPSQFQKDLKPITLPSEIILKS